MASPFPGMDPYLEHPEIWEDFHANLAGEIQAQLNPSLAPKYVAVLVPRVSYEEVIIGETYRAVKPDVCVLQVDDQPYGGTAVAIAPPPLTVPVPLLYPDPDVGLDIGLAIKNIYSRAYYQLRIDYNKPPRPALSSKDAEWVERHFRDIGLG